MCESCCVCAQPSPVADHCCVRIKHFMHPAAIKFRKEVLEPNFHIVEFDKPPSSRSESREGFWICLGWKGPPSS